MNKELKREEKILALAIVGLLWFCFSAIRHPVPYDNVLSRWDLTKAIVYQGTFKIDAYHENTNDKSVFEGHYFTDKAPGGALVGAIILYGWEGFKRVTGYRAPEALDLYIVRIFTVSLGSALAGMLLYLFGWRMGLDPFQATLLAIIYGLGTLVFPYSTMFYGNQLAAACAFGGFYVGDRAVTGGREWRTTARLFGSGLLTGLAAIIEFPAGLIALLVSGYLAVVLPRKSSYLWFLSGTLPAAGFLMMYNYCCYGNPVKLSYAYKYGQHFVDIHTQGFMGVARFSPAAFWGITFSSAKGLFYLSPVLLLGLVGLAGLIKAAGRKRYGVFFLLCFCGYILFNASFVDWPAGWTFGPRHIVPMVPYLSLGAVGLFAADSTFLSKTAKKTMFSLFLGLGSVSVLFSFLAVITNPHIPTGFSNVVTDFLVPLLRVGYLSSNVMLMLALSEAKAHIVWLLLVGLGLFLLFRKAYTVAYLGAQRSFSGAQGRGEGLSPLKPSFLIIAFTLMIYGAITLLSRGETGCEQRKNMALVLIHNEFYTAAARELQQYLQWCPATQDDTMLYLFCQKNSHAGVGR